MSRAAALSITALVLVVIGGTLAALKVLMS